MADPTLLTFTVMKNEGPFILEWVAWQRLMGVDRILVFINDCDDGTDTLLDELDRVGIVYQLLNSRVATAKDSPQRCAPNLNGISCARYLRHWRDAGCVFLSDVNEFPLLRGATCP